MAYRLLDHTADAGFEVTAPSREELFDEALRALTDVLTEVGGVAGERHRRFRLAAPDLELLLVDWLNELLVAFEVDGELFAGAAVRLVAGAAGWELDAEARGEPYDPDRHPIRTLVKAVTYHGLELRPTADGFLARVILDL